MGAVTPSAGLYIPCGLLYNAQMFVLRLVFFVMIALFVAFTMPNGLTVISGNAMYRMSNLEIILCFSILATFAELWITVRGWYFENVQKPRPMRYLRELAESIIVRDERHAKRCLARLKQLFGANDDFLVWVDGYLNHYLGERLVAKGCFYELLKGDASLLGGYSLFRLAKLSNDSALAFESLDGVRSRVRKMPPHLSRELGKLQLLRGDLDSALSTFKGVKDWRLVAVTHFLSGTGIIENLEKAYSACSGIPDIAIAYARLLAQSSKKRAGKVLLKTWRQIQTPELLSTYRELGYGIKDAEPFLCHSFVAYNEFGKWALSEGLVGMAYGYFTKAFGLCQSRETYENILKICNGNDDFAPVSAKAFSDGYLWICGTCGKYSLKWHPICPSCSDVDPYAWSLGQIKHGTAHDVLCIE